MIGSQLRPVVGRVADPLVNRLLAWGVTPDAVTATGTLGVVAAALALLPGGHFLAGTLVITLFVLTDTIDGALARKRGTTSAFGAWLDSTCDRVADGAVFGALALWYAGRGDDDVLLAVTLFVLVASLVVSYEKARAEGLGMTCDVGIAERPERLIIVLVATGLVGLGVPDGLLALGLWLLAVLSLVTLVQRLREVHRQAAVTSDAA
ncbi:MAG TPA: CDP-alcohol phosphatidyltransferase family protein [Mycobacteriales bacterium]|nr:CDP-alcohol phosphatidyltransferase family protein [Mycobacteriales bacterium]